MWMCNEPCGGNTTTIEENLSQIQQHRHLFTAISYVAYYLGPNCTLGWSNFTNVGPSLQAMGLETYPMISSLPHPHLMHWMKELFANPMPFIELAVETAVANNYTGFNIDWEPTVPGTQKDAADYANFLSTFGDALHSKSKKLSVDVATWNTFWNFTLLSASSVDRIMDMSTYDADFHEFGVQLEIATQQIGLKKLAAGLITYDSIKKGPFTDKDLSERFNMLEKNQVQEIAIWDAPLQDNWWGHLRHFKHGVSY